MTIILCWDIDGTLLTTGRAGIYAWEEAASKVLGKTVDFSRLRTAGLSDVEIARELLISNGMIDDAQLIRRMLQLYEDYLPCALPRKQGSVLPGVREALEYFHERNDVVSMLLTGNTRAGAYAKLSYYGLDAYFELGAFADGAIDRLSIARYALSVARDAGFYVSSQQRYVIGDTPHDIKCGKFIEARTVAVATGEYSLEELQKHTPWLAIKQLGEPTAFARALGID